MSEAIWFYAQHDEQKGPVTPAQLKALAQNGELLPTDLVWKEGLGDWTAASTVKGLFAGVAPPPPAPVEQPPEPPPVTPAVQAPAPIAPAASASTPGASRWANAPPTDAPPPPAATAPAAATTAMAPGVLPLSNLSGARLAYKSRDLSKQRVGQATLIVGFLFIIMTRGCDSLGERYAARLVAKSQVAKARFDDEWEAKRAKIEGEIIAARAQEDTPQREADLAKLQIQQTDLETAMRKEQAALERDSWQQLRSAARDAPADQTMWRFWRQLLFVPAVLLFVVGLLMTASTSDGPQRWICLIVLGIIAYSLFVGGVAWQ
ncbi:MAG TPA: GYF domain-containing protein [Pirellulaceae bacterium]|nr:GYF domain-containing protein [Pirellulaceae bacterium]